MSREKGLGLRVWGGSLLFCAQFGEFPHFETLAP